ncbi:FecR domain-containing protein [bacterium]|nr:FecR domain-containing protein [bacterium]
MTEEKTDSTISWKNARLEIRGKHNIYFFERKHILRIILTFVLLIVAGCYLKAVFFKDSAKIIWQQGDILLLNEQSNEWHVLTESRFSSEATLKMEGQTGKVSTPEETSHLEVESEHLSGKKAVLRYDASVTAILTEGSIIKRTISPEKLFNFDLQGLVYLTWQPTSDNQVYRISINGLLLETSGSTLIHFIEGGESKLSLIEGNLWVLPGQQKFVKVSDHLKIISGKVAIGSLHAIVYNENMFSVEKRSEETDLIRRSSFLPGFDGEGNYRQVATAHLSSGEYHLIRNGKTYLVSEFIIPIMKGDKIINSSNNPLLIKFESGDLMRLYPESEISVPESDFEQGKPPLLMVVHGDVTKNQQKESFIVNGRIRIKIDKKNLTRRIVFRTSIAMITVKGTDFEINATDARVETLVATGTVCYSDLNEKKIVEINRGYMSYIDNDGLPVNPVIIPPERFKSLLEDSFGKENKPILISKNQDLKRLSIKKGEILKFEWSKPIQESNIVLSESSYPLIKTEDPRIVMLTRKMLNGVVAGKYSVRLEAKDINEIWGEVEAQLSVLPEQSLSFLCDPKKAIFDQKETEAIKAFQQETNIRVDGIVGPETRSKIQEMLNCQ